MRVLILGGTALTGPFIVRRLVELGHEVTVFHRGEKEIELPPAVRHIHGDRTRIADYAHDLRSISPDVVVDMVALADGDTRAVMDVFRGVARRIVGISSEDVYRAYDVVWGRDAGPIQPLPLSEESELRTQMYPEGADREKILMERTLLSDPDLPGTVLRYPMVYGPNDGGRIWDTLTRMDDGRPAILLEERFAAWRWSRGYAENVALATVLAVTSERAAGRIYNVAEPDAPTMREWIEQIARVVGWHGRIVALSRDRLPDHLTSEFRWEQDWVVDTTRLRDELGYAEEISRDEALRRTVAWWRSAPSSALRPGFGEPNPADTYAAEDQVLADLGIY